MTSRPSPLFLRHLLARVFAALLLAALLPGCDDDASAPPPVVDEDPGDDDDPPLVDEDPAPAYWPTDGWRRKDAAAAGFRAGAFDDTAADAAAALPYYTSLAVIKDGWLVHESYHTPAGVDPVGPATRHHVFSVSKSVTSMTLGAAWQRGDLRAADLARTTGEVFGDLLGDLPANAPQRDISLRDVLEMRSGLRWNDAWNFNLAESPMFAPHPSCAADDRQTVCTVLHRKQRYTPGKVWNYNTFDSYLAAAFFRDLTGSALDDYAARHLFAPLGITFDPADWQSWPKGSDYTHGGAGLHMNTRDLAKLGLLMLYGGRWDGRQVVAEDWHALSTRALGEGLAATYAADGEPAAPETSQLSYGFQWWLANRIDAKPDGTLSARGLGGQLIRIWPEHGLVVVVTCDDQDLARGAGDIHAFIEAEVVAALD